MANQNVTEDVCNMDISMRPEPHLEATQDLELLAQEIAEAAVEEERRSSNSSSPTLSQSQTSDISCELLPDTKEDMSVSKEDQDSKEHDEEEKEEEEEPVVDNEESRKERGRSQSPVVDEASWEIVDAEEEPSKVTENDVDEKVNKDDDDKPAQPARDYSIVRKFIGSHDLWQKLKDMGMVCDICNDQSMDSVDNSQRQHEMDVSCSESMVICDLPQDEQEGGDNEDEVPHQLPLRDAPEEPKLPSWHGTVAGAMVVVELERLGGLLVASVKVNHTDLLSALASLQQLAASAGLMSYADVDVPSLLARAA